MRLLFWNKLFNLKISINQKNQLSIADVNMVAEPKAHQIGRKRQNVTKTGNDW